jgi:hypothetical protein
MRRVISIFIVTLLLVGSGLAQVGTDTMWLPKPKDEFGLLWRTVNYDCSRSPGGNVVTHHVTTLQKNIVCISEPDHGREMAIQVKPPKASPEGAGNRAEMQVLIDDKGKTKSVTVIIGSRAHVDLNADGVFDAMSERRPDGQMVMRILLDGKYVDVEYALSGFMTHSARSLDHSVQYWFDGNVWKVHKR